MKLTETGSRKAVALATDDVFFKDGDELTMWKVETHGRTEVVFINTETGERIRFYRFIKQEKGKGQHGVQSDTGAG